ncbi:two-component regulator propeller domain-containing protein, partial [Aquiflexum sp.]|uniref:two-component regulator propeller domain-containing protein n=1 Tax=Aquiflexum sp. TaxID=1872584 RepID=UPI003593FB2B
MAYFSALFWVSCYFPLHAQSDLKFERLSTEDGLSHNYVQSIYQDKDGFMWFGTGDGLNKYNGYNFQTYRADPRNPQHTLNSNFIYSIHEDRKERIWVGSHGLNLLDKQTESFTTFLADSTQFSYLNIPLSIYEDEEGLIWFSAGGGLNKLDPETHSFTSYLSPELTPNFGLVKDVNGIFWMGSGAGLYKFDPQSEKLSRVPLAHEDHPHPTIKALSIDAENILWIGTGGVGLFRLDTRENSDQALAYNPNNQVNSFISNNGIMEGSTGLIWLATTEGLQQIDKKANQVSTYRADPSIPGSLSSNQVSAVFQDRTGTLWVGTDNGINKLITYPKPFHSYKINSKGYNTRLEENKVNSIILDSEGMVWLGTVKGLYQFNPLNKQITNHHLGTTHSDGLIPSDKVSNIPSISAIKEDAQGGLWLGTSLGLYHLNRFTGQHTLYPCKINIEFMALDASGKLWIPGVDSKSGQAVMAVFDTRLLNFQYTEYSVNDPSGLKDGYMKGIIAGRSGDLWVAAGMWGIGCRDHKTGYFTHYLPNQEVPESMIENDVICVFEDKNGLIWAGTRIGGLYRLDVDTKVLTHFSTHDGLASNFIASITEDEQGNLWIGTSNGLSCLNPQTQSIRNFYKSDGLPDNGFRMASAFARNGKLFFGSNDGFVFFDPDSIQDNAFDPPMHITGFKVLEKGRNLTDTLIDLKYDENFFSFEFAALDYVAPEKIQYAYMLENFDGDWVLSGNRRYAAYTNLDPGEYVFRVKASNSDGIWNENEAYLHIVISPPWWSTLWAYIIYFLIGAGLMYLLHHYALNRERIKNELKIKQIEADKLYELEGIRSRFFANISHEFRTPLTLILGPLEKLLDTTEPPSNRSLYLMMERNARRLLNLINQLLDLSKLESGKLTLEAKPGNLNALLQPLAASFSSLGESRNIDFQTSIGKTDQILIFDSDKIEKIVVNLLSNAFKFTPDGGKVALVVKLKENKLSESNVKYLELTVTDSGIGIATEEKEKIFDHFYQVGNLQNQDGKGTGIGLALVRELVALHKGTITVESEVGMGSIFEVCIPINCDTGQGEVPIPDQKYTIPLEQDKAYLPTKEYDETTLPEIDSELGEKPLLLIVEDNRELSAFIASHFRPHFKVLEAINGKLGLQEAMNTVPDIIITDVMMPEMDGIELCQKLKT